MLVSPRLQQGQRRGVEQHLASAVRWLDALQATLARGKQRRSRAAIEAQVAQRLRGQHLREILDVRVHGRGKTLSLAYTVDHAALDHLEREWLGRLVLMTDQHDWTTAEIIRAYRGQSVVEGVFRTLKDPLRLALRPQYHWTDQKLHVHAFLCVVAYLLATLVHHTAVRDADYAGSVDTLFEALATIRRVTVARPDGARPRARDAATRGAVPAPRPTHRRARHPDVAVSIYATVPVGAGVPIT